MVLVRLRCNSPKRCRGKLSLTAKRSVRRAGRRVKETVTIGSARFSGKPGQTFSVKVALRSAGRSLLRAAHGRLTSHLRIVQSAPAPAQTTVKRVLLVGVVGSREVHARGALAQSRGGEPDAIPGHFRG